MEETYKSVVVPELTIKLDTQDKICVSYDGIFQNLTIDQVVNNINIQDYEKDWIRNCYNDFVLKLELKYIKNGTN